MGKKKKCRSKRTSKGIHTSIAKGTVQAVRHGKSVLDKSLKLVEAWKKGKNPWLTVDNIEGAKDRPFRRVRANSYWGDPRKRFNIFLKKEKSPNASHLQ